MLAVLTTLGGAVIDYIRGQSSTAEINRIIQTVNLLLSWVMNYIDASVRTFIKVHDAWASIPQKAKSAGDAVSNIATDVDLALGHLTGVTIPGSLTWLDDYIDKQRISPVRSAVTTIRNQVSALTKWRATIDAWRKSTVDPELSKLRAFVAFINTWPIGVLNTWHEWFDKPGKFAQWATPPLMPQLLAYVAANDHKQIRDDLGAQFLRAWAEEPDRFDALLYDWLTTEV